MIGGGKEISTNEGRWVAGTLLHCQRGLIGIGRLCKGEGGKRALRWFAVPLRGRAPFLCSYSGKKSNELV